MKRFGFFLACLVACLGPVAAEDSDPEEQLRILALAELIELRVRIDDELHRRGVMRSANQLTGELAEFLYSQAFGWDLSRNSQKSHDALHDGVRYQIKARRDYGQNGARQLSAIRNPEGFDFLAVVIFDRFYRIRIAAIVPAALIVSRAHYVGYTNSYRFHFTDEMLRLPGVVDVTASLRGRVAILVPRFSFSKTSEFNLAMPTRVS